jgi:hypothetical protein
LVGLGRAPQVSQSPFLFVQSERHHSDWMTEAQLNNYFLQKSNFFRGRYPKTTQQTPASILRWSALQADWSVLNDR